MSELPNGWVQATLQDVTAPRGEKANPQSCGDMPFLGMDHIEPHTAKLLGSQPVSDMKSSVAVFRKGDVLYGRLRPYLNKVYLAEFDGTASAEFIVFPPSEAIEQGFLQGLLRSADYREHANQRSTGDRPRVRFVNVSDFEFLLPPLLEQKRIVRKLNTLSEHVSSARDHLTAIVELSRKYRQTVLDRAFRGMLTSRYRQEKSVLSSGVELLERIRDERQSHWLESERAKLQRMGKKASDSQILKRYTAPEPVMEHDRPHDIPDCWAWAVADEVVEPGAEIVYGIVQPGPKLSEGVPYVRGMDIVDGVIQTQQLLKTSPEIAKKYERASLKGGDILLGIIRATKVAVVPASLKGANITQGTARFRPSNVTSTEYLALWLESSTAQSWLHAKYRGIDMPGLNLRDVRQLPVPLAPLEEQQEIIRQIESASATVDHLIIKAEQALELTHQLEERSLVEALAGELVLQDPNDEPASVLLDRIREVRAIAPKPKTQTRKPRAMKKKSNLAGLLDDWPTSGMTFEELRERTSGTYDQTKDELFELMSGDQPKIFQEFDESEKKMRLKKVDP